MPVRPGTVAVLAVLLGSTAFDSFSAMPQWRNFVDAPRRLRCRSRRADAHRRRCWCSPRWSASTFWLAARATGGVDARAAAANCPALMAHSLIPIVIGYVFAHYLTYLVERGQQTVIGLADPLGRGWNLLGLGTPK